MRHRHPGRRRPPVRPDRLEVGQIRVRSGTRPHYEALVRRLAGFTSHQLAERERVRDAAFRQAGITFTVYGEGEGVERTFPMDLVPRIIPADEWAHLEEGLVQRVNAQQ